MNPGIGEEAGQTARSVVDALREQPLVLVLLLINLIFIAILWFTIREQSGRKDKLIADMVGMIAACPQAIMPKGEPRP